MALEKGYPAILNKMVYWTIVDSQTVSYTGSLVLSSGKFAFVGNTYIREE